MTDLVTNWPYGEPSESYNARLKLVRLNMSRHFKKVAQAKPHLGSINTISGEIPHPNGTVAVNYVVQKGALRADVTLPPKTTGNFAWKGKTHVLKTEKIRWCCRTVQFLLPSNGLCRLKSGERKTATLLQYRVV